jgi:hypothetical protein
VIEEGDTALRVCAVAASPELTEVMVEWHLASGTCTPEHRYVSWKETPDPASAELVAGSTRLQARSVTRQAYSASRDGLEATHTITFGAIAADHQAEVKLTEAGHEYRVPLALRAAAVTARSLDVEALRGEVTVRATAVASLDEELVVALEVEGPHQIRQVAAPVPVPVRFSHLDEQSSRSRARELRRVLGRKAEPIVLSAGDLDVDEVRRVGGIEPKPDEGPPYLRRLAVVFPAPRGANSATVVVPFVELNDPHGTATADLRQIPQDVVLGSHRFRIVDVQAQGDESKVVLEIPPSEASPRFSQPRSLSSPIGESYMATRVDDDPLRRSMTLKVGDPPIVRFRGTVLHVDGPWRLDVPI